MTKGKCVLLPRTLIFKQKQDFSELEKVGLLKDLGLTAQVMGPQTVGLEKGAPLPLLDNVDMPLNPKLCTSKTEVKVEGWERWTATGP